MCVLTSFHVRTYICTGAVVFTYVRMYVRICIGRSCNVVHVCCATCCMCVHARACVAVGSISSTDIAKLAGGVPQHVND